MFCRFIRNKLLSAFLVLSSLACGAQQKSSQSIEFIETLDINGTTFYIPAPQPSREELLKNATLMYEERWDPTTGKITKTKYPDTLKLPQREPRHTPETQEDLNLLLGPYAFLAKPAQAPATPARPAPTVQPARSLPAEKTNPLSQVQFSEIVLPESTNTTNAVALPPGFFKLDNASSICSASRREVEELQSLLEADPEVSPASDTDQDLSTASAVPVAQPQITPTPLPPATPALADTDTVPALSDSITNTPVSLIASQPAINAPAEALAQIQTSTPEQPAVTSFKTATQEVEELQAFLEEMPAAPAAPQPDGPSNDSDFGKGFLIGFAGAIALTGLSKLPVFGKSARAAQPPMPLAVSAESSAASDKRQETADRLHALRTIEDIKNQRARLTRAMAQARKANDTATIEEITRRRQELTQKRRAACYCLNNSHLSRIKEERRLLTKRMTIARRQQDTRVMEEITRQRQTLTDQVKALNTEVRNCDYRATRQAFLRSGMLRLIQSQSQRRR